MSRVRVAAGLGAVGLALIVAVGGCSAGSSNDSRGTSVSGGKAGDQAPAPANAPAEKPAADLLGERQGNVPNQQPGGAPAKFQVDDRAIVYTGTITVRVKDDVDRKADEAAGIATAAGGFVGSDKRTIGDGRSEASLTLRVPAARFGAVVDQLAKLGAEEHRDVNTEDVTEAVVDVDARIASQQASVTRTRALLAQARTIGEIVSVESELTKREAELAALQAKKRRLSDLTTLSTITATLLGPDAKLPNDKPETGFVAGLKGGWKAFLASMEVLLTVLGALLPWVIALGIPIYAIIWLIRRFGRRNRPTRATPYAAAPAGPQPVPAAATAGPSATTSPGATAPPAQPAPGTLPPPPPRRTPPPPPTAG
jgi:hypothetical protein